jgi:hypothetical protein
VQDLYQRPIFAPEALAVLLEPLGAELEREADAGHGGDGAVSRPRAEEEVRATG